MDESKNKEFNDREKINVQISNIESFLLKSEYLKPKIFNKKHIDIINNSLKKQDFLSHFEFNEKISFSEASVKYGILIQSINKLFNSKLSIEDMYEQYLDATKDIILLNQYINSLILIDIIFSNFCDIITNLAFITSLFDNNLTLYDVSVLDVNENEINNKFEKLYKKLKDKPALKGIQINANLILLVFLVTMGNIYYIDKNIPDLSELMKYFTKYNNVYINNINLSLFLYLYIIITINLYLNVNKYKKQYLNYESISTNNLLYMGFNENDMNIELNNYNSNNQNNNTNKALNSNLIPNLYLYDNENILYESDNFSIKILMFQNYLKFYAFYYLSKNKIKYTINLFFESFYDLLLHIYNCNKNNKNNEKKIINNNKENNNENDNNNNTILENNIFNELNKEELTNINLSQMNLLIKNNIL